MMPAKLKFEKALEELLSAAESFGVDRIVNEPIKFLERRMGFSYSAAISALRELERRNLISLDREGSGGAITRARIKTTATFARFHKVDSRQRLVSALWNHRRPSQKHPGRFIVHYLDFGKVHAEADILQTVFYRHLEEFEIKGWIQYERGEKGRILCILLTDKFPIIK